MKKCDPEGARAADQHYHCNAAQFVPTHFVRMLKLPDAIRAQYDVTSMKSVIHAAAPCPVPVKQAMIDWWGPVLFEYYAGSEGNGMTFISSADWLTHRGSVGRPILGAIHIMGEDNETELAPNEEGAVFFESENVFERSEEHTSELQSLMRNS